MEKAVVDYPEKRKRTYIPGSKGLNKQYKGTRIAATKNQGIAAVRVKIIDKNVSVGQAVDQRGVPTYAYKIPNGKMYKTAPKVDKIPRGGSVPRVVGELGDQYQDIIGYQYGGNTAIPQYNDNGQPVTGGAAAVAQRSTGTAEFLDGASSVKGIKRIDDEFQDPSSKLLYKAAQKPQGKSNLSKTSTSIVKPKETAFAKVAGLVKYLPYVAATAVAAGSIGYAYYDEGIHGAIKETYLQTLGRLKSRKVKHLAEIALSKYNHKWHPERMDIDHPFGYPEADLADHAGSSEVPSGITNDYFNETVIAPPGPPQQTHIFQQPKISKKILKNIAHLMDEDKPIVRIKRKKVDQNVEGSTRKSKVQIISH